MQVKVLSLFARIKIINELALDQAILFFQKVTTLMFNIPEFLYKYHVSR